MPVFQLLQTEEYRLGIWKIEESEAELHLLSGLTDMPTQANAVRRKEYLAVRALARNMGIEPEKITYLPSGKPILPESEPFISISHTKDYVGVMLSLHERIGLDLEQRTDRVRKIRHKFMHPQEEEHLKALSLADDETTGLLLHWCAKEALFKAVPEDGIDFSTELQISGLHSIEAKGRFKGCFLRTDTEFVIDYEVTKDFVLTCSFSIESR